MGRQHPISLVLWIKSLEMWIHRGINLVIHNLEELLDKIFEFLALSEQTREEEPNFPLTELLPVLQQVLEPLLWVIWQILEVQSNQFDVALQIAITSSIVVYIVLNNSESFSFSTDQYFPHFLINGIVETGWKENSNSIMDHLQIFIVVPSRFLHHEIFYTKACDLLPTPSVIVHALRIDIFKFHRTS